MMKHEFEALIKGEVSNEDYEVIERVYATHPSIDCSKGKQQIANIYMLPGGMRIIRDMVPTADAMAQLEDEMRHERLIIEDAQRNIAEIKSKMAAMRR